MNLAFWVRVGRRAVGTGEGAKQVIERAILFDHDHDMLDGGGGVGNSSNRTRCCQRAKAYEHEQDGEGTADASNLCRPKPLPGGALLLVHTTPFRSSKL